MSPPTEQLIRDYLNRLSVAARGQLGPDDRRALVTRTRDFIERKTGLAGPPTAMEVARLLAGLGDPSGLVQQERQRLAVVRGELPEPTANRNRIGKVFRRGASRARSPSWHWPAQEGSRADLQLTLLEGSATPVDASAGADVPPLPPGPATGTTTATGPTTTGAEINGAEINGAEISAPDVRAASNGIASNGVIRDLAPAGADEPAARVPAQASEPSWFMLALGGREPDAAVQPDDALPPRDVPDDALQAPDLPEEPLQAPDVPDDALPPLDLPDDALHTPDLPDEPFLAPDLPDNALPPLDVPDDALPPLDVPDEPLQAPHVPNDALPPLDVPNDALHAPDVPDDALQAPDVPAAVPAKPSWPSAPASTDAGTRQPVISDSTTSGDSAAEDASTARQLMTPRDSAVARQARRALNAVAAWYRRSPLEATAVVLLGLGGVIYPPVWLLGAGVALASRMWDYRDKWTGLALPLLVTLIGTAVGIANGSHVSAGQSVHEGWVYGVVTSRVAAVLSASYLGWRSLHGRRPPAVPPWNKPHKIG